MVSASVDGIFDLRIGGEQFLEIGHDLAPMGDTIIDATGRYVFPGLIDAHVHFRDPGSPERETFLTGTAAAAASGVTTVLEMPTSNVPITTADRLEARARHLEGRSYIDFGLYAGAGFGNLSDISDASRAGAVAFKTFAHRPQLGREAAFEGMWAAREDDLLRTIREVEKTGKVHAIHCENDALLSMFSQEIDHSDTFGEQHRHARPEVVENSSVAIVAALALTTDARLHLVHLSTGIAVRLAHAARVLGADISVETCPHYLLLDEHVLDEYGSYAKCNPPLRSRSAQTDLGSAFREGLIDVVASDHCSYTTEELDAHGNDPCGALPGLPGIEFLIPYLLHTVEHHRVDLNIAVRSMTSNPAQRFGLKTKGDIAVGLDADLTIVDPHADAHFSSGEMYIARGSQNAVYLDGIELKGRVSETYVRGRSIYENGEITGAPTYGKWLRSDSRREQR